ncbi:unnamed protein product [Urochloa decumbens]|uniref:Disease resistance protein RPM1 n=1 Tax=Urochloa decumbens TaxID=240449 RepID=A0ABC9B732_9POAL
MADLSFGISKAVVQSLADKVKTALKEEAEHWQIVQRDLVFITGEFEMMQSFLNVADAERVRNDVVRTWVRQVRDLSYDVEDCIDFVLQLDTNKWSWWLRLFPSCGKAGAAALPVDEAVAETTLLRARVVDVSQRNIRYNLIVDTGSKPIDQVQKIPAANASSFDMLINAVHKSGLLDLAGLITRKDKDLQVTSVYGPEGDLGKVAIIRKVYTDSRIYDEFECRAWVKLMEPFNAHELIWTLMIQFSRHSCQEEGMVSMDAMTRMQAAQGDLVKEFAQKINTHRYLIVLEDVCTMVQWDTVRSYLPDVKKGSRIVVLTHQPVIASLCTGEPCRVSEGIQHDRILSLVKEEPYYTLSMDGLLGRDTEVGALSEQIHEHRLISLWGMPGVGKSSLVGAIYSRQQTRDYFLLHAWVSVSHPFNPTDFSRSLLLNFQSESTSLGGRRYIAHQAKDPIQECRLRLHRCDKYLVVIDGLQYKQDWDWIKSNLIGSGGSSSCIITITSEEIVAKHCAVSSNDAVMHNILVLFKKVLEENGSNLEERMEGAGDFILSKCGGLPKVIVTLARYLASKPKDLLEQEMRRLSDNFMYELETNQEFDSIRGILAWVRSYLHACPRHLKKCMMYLSIFPQNSIIRRRRLVRRWVAEGYSKGSDINIMEKNAEKLFDEVATLNNIQPVLEASKVIGYRVNSFFREYILSCPVEDRVFFTVEVSALEHERGRLTTEGIGQHLAISWKGDRALFYSLDFSRLRSLTVFTEFRAFYVSDSMRVLRVLDLENAMDEQDSDFEEITMLPPRLKFLSLRGLREISRLPDSVGDLMQLQTLDIRDTSIVTVPPFITRLQKLQYIRAGTTVAWTHDYSFAAERHPTPSRRRSNALASRLLARFRRRGPDGSCIGGGVEVPRGIKRLEALQTLGAIHVNYTDGDDIMAEIGFVLISQLKKLEFEKNDHFVRSDCDYFRLNSSLRSLKIQGHVEQLPLTIMSLYNLLKLTLEKTTLFTPDDIEVLGRLPSLRTLRLRVNTDPDGELQFPADLFSKLQVLEIASKSKLHVKFDEGAMEKLEQLNIHCLYGSEMQFFGLEHLVSLKQVWLLGSFDDTLKEALQQQLERNPKKPAPKLEVDPRSLLAPRS